MRTIFAEYNPQCNSIDVYTVPAICFALTAGGKEFETGSDLKTRH